MNIFTSLINKLRNKRITNNQSHSLTNNSQDIETLKHAQSYSKLLEIYVMSTKINIAMKSCFKFLFFLVTMGTLIVIVYFFYLSLQYAFDNFGKFENLNDVSIEAILSIVTIILPAISSLIVAFIKIPEIIAEYLFNIEEDSYMNSVIKNIQDYDKEMFAMEHKIEEMLAENKNQNIETQDEEIEDSPLESVS